MRSCMLMAMCVLSLAGFAADEKSAEVEKVIAEIKAIVEPRTLPGGKSLQDIFGMWFAKVDRTDEDGLSVRLMRGGTHTVNIYTGEHSWERIGAGNTVNIGSGDRRYIWVEFLGIEISVDKVIFPADGCPWLTNSSHTVYVRMCQSSEFNRTEFVDEYVVSLDLKKAYYLQEKKDVAYPFPFVNPRPDISQEEWELQGALPGFMSFIDERADAYRTRCLPIRPNEVRVVKTKDEDGRPEVWYIEFGADCRSLTCVDYFPAEEGKAAEAVMFSIDYVNNRFQIGGMNCDGVVELVRVVEFGALKRRRDEPFKRDFACETLTRLNLTAKDLPGIKLDMILDAK